MDGEKIYPQLMAARPDLKVVVTSGYALDGPVKDVIDAGAQGFIQKPFSFTQLLERVGAVLSGP